MPDKWKPDPISDIPGHSRLGTLMSFLQVQLTILLAGDTQFN